MPLLHSLDFDIKDNNYTKPTMPYFPEDDWVYGHGYISAYDQEFLTTGLLRVGGTDGIWGTSVGLDSYGAYIENSTSAIIDNEVRDGCPYNSAMRFYGDLDFRVHLTFRINQSSNFRFFWGLNSNSALGATTNDILGESTAHGFGLLVQEGGNFKITSNNGSATSYITSDIATIDTNVHKIYLESDSNNSRWGYSFDNSPITYISTQNPSGTTAIQPYYILKNRESGVAKSWKIYMITAMQKWRV